MCRKTGTRRNRSSSKASTWPGHSGPTWPRSAARTPATRAPDACSRWATRPPLPWPARASRALPISGKGATPGAFVPEGDFPGLLSSPTGWLIHDTLSARMHPRRACAALAAAIRAKGGSIRPEPSPGPAVEVWATGAAGLAELTQARGRLVGQGIKGTGGASAGRPAPRSAAFRRGIAYRAPRGRDHGHRLDNRARLCGPDRNRRPTRRAGRDRAPPLPGLARRTRDRTMGGPAPAQPLRSAPMLGAHPLRPGAFIANGGFKIGFGMAPGIASMMADLIPRRDRPYPRGVPPRGQPSRRPRGAAPPSTRSTVSTASR